MISRKNLPSGSSPLLRFLMCIALLAAAMLCLTGCTGQKNSPVPVQSDVKLSPIGTGSKHFAFKAIGLDGNVIAAYDIYTDENTVGAALLKNSLIAGENGAYGIYVKTVCGVTADYDTDKTYWAFYENDAYAVNSADRTNIDESTVYEFRISK